MATKSLNLSEVKTLLIVTFLLAFGFGFKFTGPATLRNWFDNFVLIFVLVAISVFVHEFAHKLVAKKFGATVETQVWYSGLVFMLLTLILTGGWLVFAVPWATVIKRRGVKPGSVFPGMGVRQNALIALAGPLANFGIVAVAKMLLPHLGIISEKLMWINATMAIANLLPFLTLLPVLAFQWSTRYETLDMPRLEGDYVFFGSRPLWVFVFAFVTIGCLALVFIRSLFGSLLLTFISAAALWVGWHWFLEPPSIYNAKQELLRGEPAYRKSIISWRKK